VYTGSVLTQSMGETLVQMTAEYNSYEKYDEEPMSKCTDYSKAFYGTSTVGERGQVVIPAEARAELGIHAGDKLLMLRHPAHAGLMMFKIEAAREFLNEFSAMLEGAETKEGNS